MKSTSKILLSSERISIPASNFSPANRAAAAPGSADRPRVQEGRQAQGGESPEAGGEGQGSQV
jgi:hypothetical protein